MDEISQREKREVLKDCYLTRSQAEAEMVGGRWKKQTETRVTGTPSYPQQPSSSPWSQSLDELTDTEPSFGVDIEFVGELGGASPAPVVMASTVETANATERGASPTALTGAPHFLRRRV
jgi:hypothetical protein